MTDAGKLLLLVNKADQGQTCSNHLAHGLNAECLRRIMVENANRRREIRLREER